MITITEKLNKDEIKKDQKISDHLSLPFVRRQITRQRVTLVSGREAGLKIQRGIILRGGDLLITTAQEIIEVISAPESVSKVTGLTDRDLQRAAYHLGNRHVPVEVGQNWIAYLHDHVLDDMVQGLGGLEVSHVEQAFEPEAGAYHGGGHSHSHGHDHAHRHDHQHSHHEH